MTNKEAIRILTLERDDWETSHCTPMVRKEAFEMAINALKAQDEKRTEERTETHSCDCISRKAAIEAMINSRSNVDVTLVPGSYTNGWRDGRKLLLDELLQVVFELPSAQPETAKRIVGKSRDGMTLWYQCDMCNEPVDVQDNFCRGCGRRLTDE